MAGKTTQKHDERGGRYLDSYKRYDVAEAGEPDNITPIIDVAIKRLRGRPAAYEESPEGLERFRTNCIGYLEYIQEQNQRPDCKKIVPDIEGLTVFLGITRNTLSLYERNRGEDWKEQIDQIKNAIMAVKKELAFHQQIPTVYAIFDQVNNGDYRNVSEFKLQAETTTTSDQIALSQEEIHQIAEQAQRESISELIEQLPDE